MDIYKQSRKILGIGMVGFLLFVGIVTGVIAMIKNMPTKLEGAWEINDGEEYIVFYDNDIAVCDGDEMIYRILDNNTLSLDGEIFEFEIIDKRNKRLMLDEKY